MEQFVQEGEESARLFVLLLISLKTLASMSKNYETLLISFYMKLLDISGLLPELSQCARCKGGLRERAYLDAGAGGALCGRCSGGAGEKVSAGSLTIMRRLLSSDWTMLERIRLGAPSAEEILSALNAYIHYHTGRELRSAKFLRSLSSLR
jgi:DNA repair protein RecO (recombination protein O)